MPRPALDSKQVFTKKWLREFAQPRLPKIRLTTLHQTIITLDFARSVRLCIERRLPLSVFQTEISGTRHGHDFNRSSSPNLKVAFRTLIAISTSATVRSQEHLVLAIETDGAIPIPRSSGKRFRFRCHAANLPAWKIANLSFPVNVFSFFAAIKIKYVCLLMQKKSGVRRANFSTFQHSQEGWSVEKLICSFV